MTRKRIVGDDCHSLCGRKLLIGKSKKKKQDKRDEEEIKKW